MNITLRCQRDCRCDYVRYLEMERLCWIIWVGLTAIIIVLVREGQKVRPRDHWSKSYTAGWKMGRGQKPRNAPINAGKGGRRSPATPWLSASEATLELPPPELKDNECVLFEGRMFVVICFSSCRKHFCCLVAHSCPTTLCNPMACM